MNVNKAESSGTGWSQLNNTLVPVITRTAQNGTPIRLAPLSIIIHAANIPLCPDIPSLKATDADCNLLNDACRSVGVDFTFDVLDTSLILLELLPVYSSADVKIRKLDSHEPLSSARYIPMSTNAKLPIADGIAIHHPTFKALQDSRLLNRGGPAITSNVIDVSPPPLIPIFPSLAELTSNTSRPALAMNSDNIKTLHVNQGKSNDKRKYTTNYKGTPKRRKALVSVKSVTFYGKQVSCLVKDDSKQQFALVEAIGRVFFPSVPLDKLTSIIADVLHMKVYELTRDEEVMFIDFYEIPTENLQCNKVINLRDLNQYMPYLNIMLLQHGDGDKKRVKRRDIDQFRPVLNSKPAPSNERSTRHTRKNDPAAMTTPNTSDH